MQQWLFAISCSTGAGGALLRSFCTPCFQMPSGCSQRYDCCCCCKFAEPYFDAVQGYFDAHATCIQRHFRGFWSRKYVHSFYARQAYLAAVARTNAEIKALCQQEYESALRWVAWNAVLFMRSTNTGAGRHAELSVAVETAVCGQPCSHRS